MDFILLNLDSVRSRKNLKSQFCNYDIWRCAAQNTKSWPPTFKVLGHNIDSNWAWKLLAYPVGNFCIAWITPLTCFHWPMLGITLMVVFIFCIYRTINKLSSKVRLSFHLVMFGAMYVGSL